MKIKKLTALALAFTVSCGVIETVNNYSPVSFTAAAEETQTESTAVFDTKTGTLTLRGNVNKNEVRKYTDAITVVAEEGTVLPEDCSHLLSSFSKATFIDLSKADTSRVKDMSYMFAENFNLESIDISGFDTSSVKTMTGMFTDCFDLTEVKMSDFDTSNVTDMGYMFDKCFKLKKVDVSSFDTSNVTDMSYMFNVCSGLTSLDVTGFDTSNVTNMAYMFCGCMELTSLDVTGFDTSKVTDMSMMFDDCRKLTSLNVKGFDTSNVTNMKFMFSGCENLTSLDLSGFGTSNVINMTNMFLYSTNLTSLDLTGFDTSKVTDMSEMFRLCKKLKSLDLSTFDTSNVNDMNGMFSGCEELESLDLSNFDTSKTVYMTNMFWNCKSLKSLDLSNFDTSNVKMMYYMFHGCSELESVDLSSFDTSKVNSMVGMFEYCYKLTTLDLSSFNTVYVCAIENMFMNCHELKTIYVGANWINDGIVVPEKIFSGCDRLTGGNGTKFDDDKVSTEYAHVDEAGNPGYFSAHEGVSLEIPAKLKSTRVTDGMLTYRVFADHAEVLKCAEDAEGEIVIAEDIEGKPVTKIGNTAFYMCKELTSVVMPDTIKEIGRGAFADMKLNEIILSSSLEIIDDIVFTHCNFGSIEFPDTLKSIGAEAFEFCNFENVVIPASVERIMAYTFSGSRINTMTVLNPECEIYDNQETLGSPRSIKGYKGSTAEAYAKKYDIKFIDIDEKLPVWGDANCDGGVDMADIVLIMQSLANPNRYGIEGTDEHHITVEGQTYADVSRGSDYEANGITGEDALEIQRYLLGKISSLVPKMP